MSLIVGIVLFLIKFLIFMYFLLRGLVLSGMFSLLEPTDFGRKIKKSFRGKGFLELDEKGKIELIPPWGNITFAMAGFFGFAFVLEPNLGFLAIAIGTLVSAWIRRNHKSDIIDERTYTQLSRILAASSELTLMVLLAFFLIFHLNFDAFALLCCFFAIREVAFSVLAQQLEDADTIEETDNLEDQIA
jgi:hypothetical protein